MAIARSARFCLSVRASGPSASAKSAVTGANTVNPRRKGILKRHVTHQRGKPAPPNRQYTRNRKETNLT